MPGPSASAGCANWHSLSRATSGCAPPSGWNSGKSPEGNGLCLNGKIIELSVELDPTHHVCATTISLLEILIPIQQSGDVNLHRHCFHSPLPAFRIKSRRPIVTESLWEMKPKRPSRIRNIGKPNREQSSLIRFPSLLPLEHLRTTGSLAYWIHGKNAGVTGRAAVSWQWLSPPCWP